MSNAHSPTINQVGLTKEQLVKWQETRVALSWHCPAFTHIFINLCSHGEYGAVFTRDMPNAAATDGTRIMINPDVFFKYDLMERLFIMAHEIAHNIFHHCILMHQWSNSKKVAYPDGVKLPFNPDMMNIALDLVINDILIDAKIGKFNKEWLHDISIATKTMTGVEAYRKLWEKFPPPPPPPKGKGPGGTGAGNTPTSAGNDPNQPPPPPTGPRGKSFDQHMKPGEAQGKEPTQAVQERNNAEWDMHIATAIRLQREQGNMPGGLERMFQEVLTPQVDWRDQIRAQMARKLGSGSYNWQKPDRRLIVRDIYTPSRSGFGAGTVVIGVDTSGSIGPKEIDMFLAEVSGVLDDVKPRELHICWCDYALHRTDICDTPSDLNEIRAKGAPGGGGTSFRPVFEYIEDNDLRPDCLLYLTDGHGDLPTVKPTYDVIWGSIDRKEFPWGETVMIPKQVA